MAGHGPAPELNEDQKEMLKERMRFYKGTVTASTLAIIICFLLTFAVIFGITGYMWVFWLLLLACLGFAGLGWLFSAVAPR
ncbi:MAG: hypothetical protein Alpg2KO_27800 [Alphaproteobacteria bacterium]